MPPTRSTSARRERGLLSAIGGDNILNKQFALQTGNANFAALWLGTFTTTVAGAYTFGESADDGATLFIDSDQNGQFSANEQVVSVSAGNAVGTVTLSAGQTYKIGIAYRAGAAAGTGTIANTFEAKWAVPGTTYANYAALPAVASGTGGVISPSLPAQTGLWGSIYGANTFEQRIYVYPNLPPQSFLDLTSTASQGLLNQAPTPMGQFNPLAGYTTTSRLMTMNAQGGINNASGAVFTMNGVISTGLAFAGLNGGFSKFGANTVLMGNANTYVGPTVIRTGILQVNALANGGDRLRIQLALARTPRPISGSTAATLQYADSRTTAGSTDRSFTLTTNGGNIDNSSTAATSTMTQSGTAPIHI